jgi:hypothetical protein
MKLLEWETVYTNIHVRRIAHRGAEFIIGSVKTTVFGDIQCYVMPYKSITFLYEANWPDTELPAYLEQKYFDISQAKKAVDDELRRRGWGFD